MPRYGHIADVLLNNLYTKLSSVGLALKGTPQRRYDTASGELQAAPGAGYKLRVYGVLIANEGDEITRLRYNGAAGTIFAILPTKGAVFQNMLHLNEAGGESQNIYVEKSGAGNTLVVAWTETVVLAG